MTRPGPAPKPADERIRRNKPVAPLVVTDDGVLRGSPLPRTRDWPKETLDWWATWRRSPQAQTFTATDWLFLLDTAPLHAALWGGDLSVAAELRLRMAKYGATPEDRMRLKIAIGQPPEQPTLRVATKETRSRREGLMRAVGE